jgi:3-methyladenine DNA glycosylase Tag
VQRREGWTPDFNLKDEEILGRLIALIAFSNNANASKVNDLVNRQVFKPIFDNYSVEKTAARSADDIKRAHWQEIGAIRFKYKVDAMVNCTGCLLKIRDRHGSFMRYLRSLGLPTVVKSESDIRVFWDGFCQIRNYFREIELFATLRDNR